MSDKDKQIERTLARERVEGLVLSYKKIYEEIFKEPFSLTEFERAVREKLSEEKTKLLKERLSHFSIQDCLDAVNFLAPPPAKEQAKEEEKRGRPRTK